MPSRIRDAVAHAASPWYWRSDTAFWVLVLSMCAPPIISVVIGLAGALTGDGLVALERALLATALYYLLLARPAIRSLRKRRLLAAARTSA